MCGIKIKDGVPGRVERETRVRRYNLGTTAKQIVMVWVCSAKRRHDWMKKYMEYEVEGAGP